MLTANATQPKGAGVDPCTLPESAEIKIASRGGEGSLVLGWAGARRGECRGKRKLLPQLGLVMNERLGKFRAALATPFLMKVARRAFLKKYQRVRRWCPLHVHRIVTAATRLALTEVE